MGLLPEPQRHVVLPSHSADGHAILSWRSGKEPVQGMDWLAFELEHAMLCAINRTRKGRGPPPGGGWQVTLAGDGDGDGGPPGGDWNISAGYLHTYTTLHPLNLLYIDGMSAGKTHVGTLDTQDFALLNDTIRDHPIYWDRERGEALCRVSREDWEGAVDGFLRMESGFEVILCDFQRHLRTERVTRGRPQRSRQGIVDGMGVTEFFAYYQAVATRYWGLGRERVAIGFEEFVTAFRYEGLDLFEGRGDGKPRLKNVQWMALEPLRRDVRRLVAEGRRPGGEGLDWQSVADKIVLRYEKRLRNLLSEGLGDTEKLGEEIQRILQPFVDFDERDAGEEVERCTRQFIPESASLEALAAQAVASVSNTICNALSSAEDAVARGECEIARESVRELLEYLDWSVWKDCGGCGDDEICFVPMWPWGRREDYEKPACTNASALQEKHGYWQND